MIHYALGFSFFCIRTTLDLFVYIAVLDKKVLQQFMACGCFIPKPHRHANGTYYIKWRITTDKKTLAQCSARGAKYDNLES